MPEYRLPPLPLGAQHATLLRWLKRASDRVTSGDPLLIVVNDRAEITLAATCDGVLTATRVAAGADIAVGALLAVIAPAANASSADVAQTQLADSAPRAARRAVSPVARRIAALTGASIDDLVGSGVSGRILKADVLALLATHDAAAQEVAFTQSQVILPPSHTHAAPIALTTIEVDLGRVAAVIERLQASFARRGIALTYTACIALAAVEALCRHPLLNSAWDDDRMLLWRRVHLAIVPDDRGAALLIRDAQDLNLRGLARALTAARITGATASTESTFSITDTGGQRWREAPLFSPHQSAALGVGSIIPRPLVICDRGVDRIAVRPSALLTLCYDARSLDQSQADAFLRAVKGRLEEFDR